MFVLRGWDFHGLGGAGIGINLDPDLARPAVIASRQKNPILGIRQDPLQNLDLVLLDEQRGIGVVLRQQAAETLGVRRDLFDHGIAFGFTKSFNGVFE